MAIGKKISPDLTSGYPSPLLPWFPLHLAVPFPKLPFSPTGLVLGSNNSHQGWEKAGAGLQARRAGRHSTSSVGLSLTSASWLCNSFLTCAKILPLRKPEFENLTLSRFKNNHWSRCSCLLPSLLWCGSQHCCVEPYSGDQNTFSFQKSKNILF